MTVSGTTIFDLNMIEAIEEAFERCGLEGRSGYDQRTARRSINLMFADWANRGVNLWTVEERSQVLTQEDGEYTLGADNDIVDVIEQMIEIPAGSGGSSGPTRYNMTRVSVSTHATRTNPDITGRPVEVWYDRTRGNPIAHIWPLPDGTYTYTMIYWVLRRMDDAGAYTNTTDMPFRFLPAFIAGLAFYLAQKKRTDDPALIARLEADYEKTWLRAAETDRETATLSIVPRGGTYRIL